MKSACFQGCTSLNRQMLQHCLPVLVRSRDKDGKQIWLDVSVQQLSCTQIEDPISVLDLSHLKMDDTFSRNCCLVMRYRIYPQELPQIYRRLARNSTMVKCASADMAKAA